jgi:hypothetical protein
LDGFWKAALVRKDAVDLLKGTALEEMSKALGFWALRLDNVFEEDLHAELAKKMAQAFDPNAGGVSETLGRKNAMPKGQFQYKVLNMCKYLALARTSMAESQTTRFTSGARASLRRPPSGASG